MNLHFAGWQGGSGIILKSRADFGDCVTEVPPYKCTKNTLKRFSSKSYSVRLPRICTHVEY